MQALIVLLILVLILTGWIKDVFIFLSEQSMTILLVIVSALGVSLMLYSVGAFVSYAVKGYCNLSNEGLDCGTPSTAEWTSDLFQGSWFGSTILAIIIFVITICLISLPSIRAHTPDFVLQAHPATIFAAIYVFLFVVMFVKDFFFFLRVMRFGSAIASGEIERKKWNHSGMSGDNASDEGVIYRTYAFQFKSFKPDGLCMTYSYFETHSMWAETKKEDCFCYLYDKGNRVDSKFFDGCTWDDSESFFQEHKLGKDELDKLRSALHIGSRDYL